MLNDIIIDKIKIILPKDKEKAFQLAEDLENTFKWYFPRYSFNLYYRYNYFFIEFNPTRYSFIYGRLKKLNSDDLNLQMIPEQILLSLFQKLGLLKPHILKHLKVTELHIAKNLIVEGNVQCYLDMLVEIEAKNSFEPILFRGNRGNSIYFARLTSDKNINKEYTDHILFKFYDKKAEIISKHKAKHKAKNHYQNKNRTRTLKSTRAHTFKLMYEEKEKLPRILLREPLLQYEQDKLGRNYNDNGNSVNINDINLFRVELAYKPKRMNDIYKALDGSNLSIKGLPLLSFIKYLREDSLYSKLNDLFIEQLKENIFHEDINKELCFSGSLLRTGLSCMKPNKILNNNSDLYYVKNVLSGSGYSDKVVRDRASDINTGIIKNRYYIELYKLLFDTPFPQSNCFIDYDFYGVEKYDESLDGFNYLDYAMNDDDYENIPFNPEDDDDDYILD